MVSYYAVQFQKINNKRTQAACLELISYFNKYMLSYVNKEIRKPFKLFSIYNTSIFIKGRFGGFKFCNRLRYEHFFLKPIIVNSFNTQNCVLSLSKSIFITR